MFRSPSSPPAQGLTHRLDILAVAGTRHAQIDNHRRGIAISVCCFALALVHCTGALVAVVVSSKHKVNLEGTRDGEKEGEADGKKEGEREREERKERGREEEKK